MDNMIGSGVLPVVNTNGGDNWGGNWLWGILLFALLGGRGFGWGNGGWNGAAEALSNEYIYNGLSQTLNQGFTQVANQGFDTRESIWQTNANLQMQLAQNGFNAQQCCCETNRNIDAIRYENAQNTCNIINSASNDTQRILDKLCQMESNAKDQRISDLQLQLQSAQGQLSNLAQTASIVSQVRPTPVPAFVVGNPYYASGCGNYSCGC